MIEEFYDVLKNKTSVIAYGSASALNSQRAAREAKKKLKIINTFILIFTKFPWFYFFFLTPSTPQCRKWLPYGSISYSTNGKGKGLILFSIKNKKSYLHVSGMQTLHRSFLSHSLYRRSLHLPLCLPRELVIPQAHSNTFLSTHLPHNTLIFCTLPPNT